MTEQEVRDRIDKLTKEIALKKESYFRWKLYNAISFVCFILCISSAIFRDQKIIYEGIWTNVVIFGLLGSLVFFAFAQFEFFYNFKKLKQKGKR